MDKITLDKKELLSLTTEIVSSHVAHNDVQVGELPALIEQVFTTLDTLGHAGQSALTSQQPAVPIKDSIHPGFIVCLEDGKKLKMLKRHLMAHYNLTPEQYREKWGLPADYPMVAPDYAIQRRALAKKIGLGRAKK
ncbi:MucR family transcriptional regulator [Kordiimonas sediminis]|nr:MucR family transcriptional regulator [Kordiimonas sediminis]